jgi:hypothetical protein
MARTQLFFSTLALLSGGCAHVERPRGCVHECSLQQQTCLMYTRSDVEILQCDLAGEACGARCAHGERRVLAWDFSR